MSVYTVLYQFNLYIFLYIYIYSLYTYRIDNLIQDGHHVFFRQDTGRFSEAVLSLNMQFVLQWASKINLQKIKANSFFEVVETLIFRPSSSIIGSVDHEWS